MRFFYCTLIIFCIYVICTDANRHQRHTQKFSKGCPNKEGVTVYNKFEAERLKCYSYCGVSKKKDQNFT